MKVAAIQMLSSTRCDDNLQRAAALVRDAAAAGARLIVLPENFALMGKNEEDKLLISEAAGTGPIQQMLSDLARELSVFLVGGTIPVRSPEPGRVYAWLPVYAPDGRCLAHYEKLHLFDVQLPHKSESYLESRGIMPGEQIVTVTLDAAEPHPVCLGLSVCYDLRFPELYRDMVAQGAHILLVPAAFTANTGHAHWLTLLKARAIENQCFVIAPNQGGHHENGRDTYGHSVIIDPWGTILAQAELGEAVVCAELDFAEQNRIRTHFPALKHIRLAVAAQVGAVQS